MQSVRLAVVAALTAFIVAFSIVSAQELELTSSSLWGGVNDIETVGNCSFAAFYNGLVVYDVSDPANIVEISRLFCDGSGMDLEIAGDHAFLADGETGLRIIDISDPPHPSLISRYDTPGFCNSVRVVDDFAYLTDGDHGIWIVDVSDVLNPTLLGGEDTPGNATDIAVVEDWAFVADGAHGVQRINISDPSNPSSYGYIDTPDVDWLMIRDQVLIVKAISHYILFIDISNLTNPQLLNTIIVPESLSDLSFVGDYMLVSTVYPGSIWIFASAGNAQFDSFGVFRFEDEYYLSNLRQFDTYLLCSSSQYIFSLNVINPSQPRIIGNVENNGFAQNVTLAGNLVFIVDVSDPQNPLQTAYTSVPRAIHTIDVEGDYIYAACEHSLMIFEYAQIGIENESPTPGRLSLAQNYPNPFNASTVIRYGLPSPADVRLDIYDLLGRQVDTIEPGLQGAGTHTLRWNAEGKASGVYSYKLRTEEHSETKRMLLIK